MRKPISLRMSHKVIEVFQRPLFLFQYAVVNSIPTFQIYFIISVQSCSGKQHQWTILIITMRVRALLHKTFFLIKVAFSNNLIVIVGYHWSYYQNMWALTYSNFVLFDSNAIIWNSSLLTNNQVFCHLNITF